MTFSINKPTLAVNQIDIISKKQETQNERLASGLKINSAKDNAAGLQIANRLTSEINQLEQLSNNAGDQVKVNKVADAQLSSISSSLLRANELSIQSSNPLYSNSVIQSEFDQLSEEINLVAEQALGNSDFISGLDASDPASTQQAISEALETVDNKAVSLGAQSNALDSRVSTYEVSNINNQASRSRILDTDYAQSSSEQQTNNLLLQASLIVQQQDDDRKGLLINKLV